MNEIVKQQIITFLQSNQPGLAKTLCLESGLTSIDPHVMIMLANAQLRLGEVDAAVSSAREAIQRGWNDPNALVMLIALLLHRGEQADASAWLPELCCLVHDKSEAYRLVAKALRQMGDRDNAIEQFHNAVKHAPENSSTRYELGSLLQESRRFADAIVEYEKILVQDTENIHVLCNLSLCFSSLKQFDSALGILQRAYALEPSNLSVNFYLGETYQNRKQYTEAIASYQRAIEQSPDSVILHGSLARALYNLGELEDAITHLRHAQRLDSANATVYNDLGICLYDDANMDASRRAFSESVRLNPGGALTHFYLGVVLHQSGDTGGANQQFTEAVSLWPYLKSSVESFLYARKAGPDARYFCTSKQVYEYAISNADEKGLFLEFGVYHGASINIIARLVPGTVHGFDTFQGLPMDWVLEHDGQHDVEPAGYYSTHGHLPEAPENVRYHVGTFDDTMPEFCRENTEPVSFMNVDCDLYESTKSIFREIGGQIQPGTIIVFDDYLCLPGWREHEYKAFHEYLSDSGLGYEYLAFNIFTGQATVKINKTLPDTLPDGQGFMNAHQI